ncbi:hypothetical protein [Labrys neptuniae]
MVVDPMCEIVSFPSSRAKRHRHCPPMTDRSGQILFFTGVRYAYDTVDCSCRSGTRPVIDVADKALLSHVAPMTTKPGTAFGIFPPGY